MIVEGFFVNKNLLVYSKTFHQLHFIFHFDYQMETLIILKFEKFEVRGYIVDQMSCFLVEVWLKVNSNYFAQIFHFMEKLQFSKKIFGVEMKFSHTRFHFQDTISFSQF